MGTVALGSRSWRVVDDMRSEREMLLMLPFSLSHFFFFALFKKRTLFGVLLLGLLEVSHVFSRLIESELRKAGTLACLDLLHVTMLKTRVQEYDGCRYERLRPHVKESDPEMGMELAFRAVKTCVQGVC